MMHDGVYDDGCSNEMVLHIMLKSMNMIMMILMVMLMLILKVVYFNEGKKSHKLYENKPSFSQSEAVERKRGVTRSNNSKHYKPK